MEDTCFAYEVPNSGPYRKAYKLGYRFAVCTRLEKPAHSAHGIIFIEPCEEDDTVVKNRIRRRQARKARAEKKKPLTSISRNQGPSRPTETLPAVHGTGPSPEGS